MTHGGSAYSNHDCRCAVCTDGWRLIVTAQRVRLRLRQGDGHECKWRKHSEKQEICKICCAYRARIVKNDTIVIGEFKEILHLTEKPTEESSPMRAHDVTSHGRPDAAL